MQAQREIENAISMENIEENWKQAMEHNPEAFASVVMLYVPCEVGACMHALTLSVISTCGVRAVAFMYYSV